MLKWMKAYALVAILTLGLATVFAARAMADDGKLVGNVIDFDGKPWADLPLKLKSEQGVSVDGKTDAKGDYAFMNLRYGKYTLIIAVPQTKEPFEIPVVISANPCGTYERQLQGNIGKAKSRGSGSV